MPKTAPEPQLTAITALSRWCWLKPRVAAEPSARSSVGESQRLIQEILGPPEPQAYDAESPQQQDRSCAVQANCH